MACSLLLVQISAQLRVAALSGCPCVSRLRGLQAHPTLAHSSRKYNTSTAALSMYFALASAHIFSVFITGLYWASSSPGPFASTSIRTYVHSLHPNPKIHKKRLTNLHIHKHNTPLCRPYHDVKIKSRACKQENEISCQKKTISQGLSSSVTKMILGCTPICEARRSHSSWGGGYIMDENGANKQPQTLKTLQVDKKSSTNPTDSRHQEKKNIQGERGEDILGSWGLP